MELKTGQSVIQITIEQCDTMSRMDRGLKETVSRAATICGELAWCENGSEIFDMIVSSVKRLLEGEATFYRTGKEDKSEL